MIKWMLHNSVRSTDLRQRIMYILATASLFWVEEQSNALFHLLLISHGIVQQLTVNLFISFSEEVSHQACWQQPRWIQGKLLLDNNVLKMYILYSNTLPEIPPLLSNEEGWGSSRTAVFLKMNSSFKLDFFKGCMLRRQWLGSIALYWMICSECVTPPGFRNERNRRLKESSSAIVVHKEKPTSRLKPSPMSSVLRPNVFIFPNKWNKTPFVSQSGIWEVKSNTLYYFSCPVTHCKQLVCTAAKVNSDNEKGFRLNFTGPTSLSYTNTHMEAPV